MQDPVRAAGHHAERPGRWVAEAAWPLAAYADGLRAGAGTLGAEPGARADCGRLGRPRPRRRRLVRGRRPAATCRPTSAREDGRSLRSLARRWTSALEILGFPEVELALAADRPLALVAVRLCDVAPDGASLLVTRGLLNLTHRDSHEHPSRSCPGARYDVASRLDAIAHPFPAGPRCACRVSTVLLAARLALARARHADAAGARPRWCCRARAARRRPAAAAARRAGRAAGRETLAPARPTARTARPRHGPPELRFDWDLGGRRRLVEAGTEMEDTASRPTDHRRRPAVGGGRHVRCTTGARPRRVADVRADRLRA